MSIGGIKTIEAHKWKIEYFALRSADSLNFLQKG